MTIDLHPKQSPSLYQKTENKSDKILKLQITPRGPKCVLRKRKQPQKYVVLTAKDLISDDFSSNLMQPWMAKREMLIHFYPTNPVLQKVQRLRLGQN